MATMFKKINVKENLRKGCIILKTLLLDLTPQMGIKSIFYVNDLKIPQ